MGAPIQKTTEDLEQMTTEKDETIEELEKEHDGRAKDKELRRGGMREVEKGVSEHQRVGRVTIGTEGKLSETVEESSRLGHEAENFQNRLKAERELVL